MSSAIISIFTCSDFQIHGTRAGSTNVPPIFIIMCEERREKGSSGCLCQAGAGALIGRGRGEVDELLRWRMRRNGKERFPRRRLVTYWDEQTTVYWPRLERTDGRTQFRSTMSCAGMSSTSTVHWKDTSWRILPMRGGSRTVLWPAPRWCRNYYPLSTKVLLSLAVLFWSRMLRRSAKR